MSEKRYFYSSKGTGIKGPCSLEDIQSGIVEGVIPAEAEMCPEGGSDWRPVMSMLGELSKPAPSNGGKPSHEKTAAYFYSSTEYGIRGPVSYEQLKALVRRSELEIDSNICLQGGNDWLKLVSVFPELQESAPSRRSLSDLSNAVDLSSLQAYLSENQKLVGMALAGLAALSLLWVFWPQQKSASVTERSTSVEDTSTDHSNASVDTSKSIVTTPPKGLEQEKTLPSEDQTRTYIADHVARESNGNFDLKRFSKQNGVESMVDNVDYYDFEFEAKVRVQQKCRWAATNYFERTGLIFKTSEYVRISDGPGGWLGATQNPGTNVEEGDEITFVGSLQFQKAENGWRPVRLDGRFTGYTKATEALDPIENQRSDVYATHLADDNPALTITMNRLDAVMARSTSAFTPIDINNQGDILLREAISQDPENEKYSLLIFSKQLGAILLGDGFDFNPIAGPSLGMAGEVIASRNQGKLVLWRMPSSTEWSDNNRMQSYFVNEPLPPTVSNGEVAIEVSIDENGRISGGFAPKGGRIRYWPLGWYIIDSKSNSLSKADRSKFGDYPLDGPLESGRAKDNGAYVVAPRRDGNRYLLSVYDNALQELEQLEFNELGIDGNPADILGSYTFKIFRDRTIVGAFRDLQAEVAKIIIWPYPSREPIEVDLSPEGDVSVEARSATGIVVGNQRHRNHNNPWLYSPEHGLHYFHAVVEELKGNSSSLVISDMNDSHTIIGKLYDGATNDGESVLLNVLMGASDTDDASNSELSASVLVSESFIKEPYVIESGSGSIEPQGDGSGQGLVFREETIELAIPIKATDDAEELRLTFTAGPVRAPDLGDSLSLRVRLYDQQGNSSFTTCSIPVDSGKHPLELAFKDLPQHPSSIVIEGFDDVKEAWIDDITVEEHPRDKANSVAQEERSAHSDIEAFIRNHLENARDDNVAESASHYLDGTDYFNNTRTVEQIQADKISYYQSWPVRSLKIDHCDVRPLSKNEWEAICSGPWSVADHQGNKQTGTLTNTTRIRLEHNTPKIFYERSKISNHRKSGPRFGDRPAPNTANFPTSKDYPNSSNGVSTFMKDHLEGTSSKGVGKWHRSLDEILSHYATTTSYFGKGRLSRARIRQIKIQDNRSSPNQTIAIVSQSARQLGALKWQVVSEGILEKLNGRRLTTMKIVHTALVSRQSDRFEITSERVKVQQH